MWRSWVAVLCGLVVGLLMGWLIEPQSGVQRYNAVSSVQAAYAQAQSEHKSSDLSEPFPDEVTTEDVEKASQILAEAPPRPPLPKLASADAVSAWDIKQLSQAVSQNTKAIAELRSQCTELASTDSTSVDTESGTEVTTVVTSSAPVIYSVPYSGGSTGTQLQSVYSGGSTGTQLQSVYSGGSTGTSVASTVYQSAVPYQVATRATTQAYQSPSQGVRRGLFGRRVVRSSSTCRMVTGADGRQYKVCE